MKTIKKIIPILVLSFIITSCNKNDDDNDNISSLSSNKQILSFQFLTSENSISANIIGEIDEENKTIIAIVPNDTDNITLLPSISISENATISPNVVQNFSSPIVYTVTAEDGSTAEYVVTVQIEPNDEKEILSFQFLISENSIGTNVIGEIDEENKTIIAIVPNDTDKSALLPSVSISENATISPNIVQDFTVPVEYTVTAEDGTTVTYEVVVKTVNDTQYEIMLAFYNANPDMNTVSWNPDETDVSLWQGVSVNSDGYIVGINLTGPSGTPGIVYFQVIPTQVEQLEYLMELEFLNNEISSIPAEIAQLGNLTSLDLRSNNLSTIPQAVCDMEIDYGTTILIDAGVTCE